MLHVALAGLLAGSLALTPPDDTGDDKKNPDRDKAPVEAADAADRAPGVFEAAEAEGPETITLDTYALGRPADQAPIKLWAQYAYGTAADIYLRNNDVARIQLGNENAEIISQRIAVGAQVNVISFERFRLGAGGILGIAKNELNFDDDTGPIGAGNIESDFGLQHVKVYGIARGRTLGIHGGYAFDLGNDQEFTEIPGSGGAEFPADLARSDNRDAVFFGADFDYPSERFRLMGGIDYFDLKEQNDNPNTAINEEAEGSGQGGDFLNFMFGAGLRFPVFEIGAAIQLQSRFDEPTVQNIGTTRGIGSHIGMVVPYLRISPPNLPASLYIKGATPDEYLEYGYPIGGQNSVQPGLGFTAGLSVGFE